MANSNDTIESEVKVSGEYMRAWNVAYSAFMEIDDLSDKEKELKYYDIEFSEDNDNYIVFFFPRLISELFSKEEAKHYNVRAIGRETRYWINKDTYKIVERLFYKG